MMTIDRFFESYDRLAPAYLSEILVAVVLIGLVALAI
jgi:hypothetical protein